MPRAKTSGNPEVFAARSGAAPRQAAPAPASGVGSMVAKSFVELHGGRTEAHSEGPDRGAEIVVRLPADEAAT